MVDSLYKLERQHAESWFRSYIYSNEKFILVKRKDAEENHVVWRRQNQTTDASAKWKLNTRENKKSKQQTWQIPVMS